MKELFVLFCLFLLACLILGSVGEDFANWLKSEIESAGESESGALAPMLAFGLLGVPTLKPLGLRRSLLPYNADKIEVVDVETGEVVGGMINASKGFFSSGIWLYWNHFGVEGKLGGEDSGRRDLFGNPIITLLDLLQSLSGGEYDTKPLYKRIMDMIVNHEVL